MRKTSRPIFRTSWSASSPAVITRRRSGGHIYRRRMDRSGHVCQRAIVMVLELVYEQDFLSCSYGFRPGRSAHQALEDLRTGFMRHGLRWVIDLDIEKYFDSISHPHLRTFLDRRVTDGVIRRMIDKWLKAVVGIVAPHHRNQMGVLLGDRPVPVFPAPLADRRQRAGVTALRRYLPHHVLAVLRLAPYVAEAEKGERRAIRFRMSFPICRLKRKSTKRVLSGWSVSSYRPRRLPRTPRTRWASRKSSNAITASSAYRTRVLLPLRRGFTSFSNHSSNTWCRKIFDKQGETTPPCGEPSVPWRRSPSSRTPDHFCQILGTVSAYQLNRRELPDMPEAGLPARCRLHGPRRAACADSRRRAAQLTS